MMIFPLIRCINNEYYLYEGLGCLEFAMGGIVPSVRHMILCESAHRNPDNPKKVDVHGLLSTIRSDVIHVGTCSFVLPQSELDFPASVVKPP